jgi:hypothetical protein
MLKRLQSEERGIALVTALLVSMIVLALGMVAVGLSLHNSSASSLDRKRTQAIDAAEAGLDSFSSQLTTTNNSSMPCPLTVGAPNESVDLPTSPPAHFDLYVSFYSTWPPKSTPDLTCAQVQGGAVPAAALVKSVGSATATAAPTMVQRTMESTLHLTPIYGGFNKAIFSDRQLGFGNKFTLNGNGANNGDVYTNGNFTLSNNTLIKGSVYAQGTATIGQGVVNADVWAKNAVSLSNGIQVLGNATSSTSSITLDNNSTVFGNAKAGTSVSGGTINGTITQNSPSGPPPQVTMPKYCWPGCDPQGNPNSDTQQAFIDLGYTIQSYTDCAAAQTDIANWFGASGGDYVVVVNSATPCSFDYGGNGTTNVRGNLAIFFTGTATDSNGTATVFSTQSNVTFNGTGANPYQLFIVRSWQSGLCPTNPMPTPNFRVSNSTSFNNLTLFLYTPCRIDFGNNNAGGVNGQIIGGQVNITNQMVMNYVPVIAPAFNLLGYNSGIAYKREISNGT